MFGSLLLALGLHFFVATTTIQSYICNGASKPTITAPFNGATVTSGAVAITGNATPSSQVTLSLDGQAVDTTTADQYDNFSAQIMLPDGQHTIGVTSSSPCGNRIGDDITLTGVAPIIPPVITPNPPANNPLQGVSQQSGGAATPSVSATPSTPGIDSGNIQIQITAPRDRSRIVGSSVYVRGTLSAPATIRISRDGTLVAQAYVPAMTFGFSIPLNVGMNTLTIEAHTDNGDASATLRVTRLADCTTTSGSTPWWRTTPVRIAAIIIIVAIVIGLLIWFIVLAI